MSKHLIICDFTADELNYLREHCNFVGAEKEYFELRSQGKSNILASHELHCSERTIDNISKKVRRKILRALAK